MLVVASALGLTVGMNAILVPADEAASRRSDAAFDEANAPDDSHGESAPEADRPKLQRSFDAQLDFNWHQGRSSLWWTLRALDGARRVGDITVVAMSDDSPAQREFIEGEVAEFARARVQVFESEDETKSKNADNTTDWLAQLERVRPYLERPTLGCTASTPAATPEDYDAFIARFEHLRGDGALPLVPRAALEQITGAPANPPFSPFADDAWRFGYCVILSIPVVEGLLQWVRRIEQIASQMEVPEGQTLASYAPLIGHGWKLGREIGWGFLWRAYKKRLTPQGAGKKVSHLLGCRARAIEVERPHLALTTSFAQWPEQMPQL